MKKLCLILIFASVLWAESANKSGPAQAKAAFKQNCVSCHGENGKAEASLVATDLTQPGHYKHGTSDAEIFKSIKEGAGNEMPPFKYQMPDDKEIWALVNYVRSLWPEPPRSTAAE